MTDGALVVSLCAAVCMGLALLQTRLRRGRGIVATVFGLVLVASLAGPLYLRGAGEPTPPPRTPVAAQLAPAQSSARVHMILLDGASLDFIAPNAAGGRFPNFGRLLDSGAVMHLATLRPTQPAPVWTAVATGKLPYKTSVYSAGTLRRSRIGSAAGSASRLLFCAGARASRIDRRGRARVRCRARAADLGAVERLRHHRGRHRLAADVSGARRQRLSHQRRVSPSRSGIGDRVDGRAAARVSAEAPQRRRASRGRAPRPGRRRSCSRRSRRRARGCAKDR